MESEDAVDDYIVTLEKCVSFISKWATELDLPRCISITPSILNNEEKPYDGWVKDSAPLRYTIRICTLNITSERQLEEVILHEMLHIKLGRLFKLINHKYNYDENPELEEEIVETLTNVITKR
jgi:hypothetical protein